MFKLIGNYTDEDGVSTYDQSIARIDPLTAGRHINRFVSKRDYVILNVGLSPSTETITDVILYYVGKPMSENIAVRNISVLSDENDNLDEPFEMNMD
ncbi:MAG: hypothetical protein Q4G33_06785 [bacterium]|nr:hypothetical protein [bacterium]